MYNLFVKQTENRDKVDFYWKIDFYSCFLFDFQ